MAELSSVSLMAVPSRTNPLVSTTAGIRAKYRSFPRLDDKTFSAVRTFLRPRLGDFCVSKLDRRRIIVRTHVL
jgi:hypothetical protein